jgi:Tol biopolymer transport system component
MSKADPSGAAQFLRDQSIAPTPHAASGPRGILFVSTQDGVANIYLINEDGTEQVRLTQNGRNNLSPGWSPDGRQIALLSSEVGAESITYHLYMMDSEGIEPADITPLLDQSVESLAWSPDGQRIALVANPAPEEGTFAGTNVFVANKDGSTLTQITHMDSGTVGCWSPIWAPDGSKLVFICRALMQVAIEIANADGLDRWNYEYGQVSQVFLLPSGEHVGFAGGICSSLGVFSIEFLLTHGASSAGPWPCLDQDLEALGVDLTSPYEVSWSPLVDTQFAIQTTQSLYIIDLARYAVNVVRFESKRLNGPPSWAPNGDRIAFAAEGGNDSEIYVLNLVNNEVVQLTDNEVDDTMPAWRP